MRRTAFSRAVSLLVALLVASSAPSVAIAHGNAHLAAAQRGLAHPSAPADVDHGHDHELPRAPESSDAPEGATLSADDHDDHVHPLLTSAVGTRPDAQLFVVPVGPRLAFSVVSISSANSFDGTRAIPGGPPLDSPRQPRAPPLG